MQCTICFHAINSYWCCTCSSGFMLAVFSFTCHPECQTVPEGWGRPAQRLHTKWAPLDSCWCPFALQPLHDQVLSAAMAPNTRCTLDPDVDVGVIRLSSLMTSHGRADSMHSHALILPRQGKGGSTILLRRHLIRRDKDICVSVCFVFFSLTDRASTIPSNIRGCQSGTWFAGQEKKRTIDYILYMRRLQTWLLQKTNSAVSEKVSLWSIREGQYKYSHCVLSSTSSW